MPFSFQGLKFWVSIHTPNRTKADINSHGGILVANEADADVRIMDPARAGSNPPPNMISPAWISECIKRQRQVDEEPFRVSKMAAQPIERRRQEPPPVREGRRQEAPTMPRPPAGSHTRVRNEYTAEDDHILVQWMRMQAARCAAQDVPLSTKGTKIYKELEQRCPHHTFHSWRARWLTRLSATTDLSVPPEGHSQLADRPQRVERPRLQTRTPGRNQAIEPEQAQSQAVSKDNSAGISGAPDELFFMDYDDFYIIKTAYIEWKKQMEQTGERAKPESTFFERAYRKKPYLSAQEWHHKYDKLRFLYTNSPSANEERSAAAPEKGSAGVLDEAQDNFEDQDHQDDDSGDDGLDIDVDTILNGVEVLDYKQQQFLACLDAYNEFLQVYVPPSFFIGGRYIETYTLWTAMQGASSGEPDRRSWGSIVKALGLDSTMHPALETQLAAWYDQNLKTLSSFLKEYLQECAEVDDVGDQEDDSNDDEEDVEVGAKDENGVAESDDDHDGEDVYPDDDKSAKNAPSAGKTTEPPDHGTGLISSARKLLSAAFLGGSRAAVTEARPAETPSKRVRIPGRDHAEAHSEEKDVDDASPSFETRLRAARVPARKTTANSDRMITEPETQDFAYDPETQQPEITFGDDEEEEVNTGQTPREEHMVTPSQQLLAANRNVAAVPLSLPASRRKRPAASPALRRDVPKRVTR
ncbi:hypothetical protein SEPCBS57363_004051 [Sporothrix epigloea]|uniref:DNA-binding protein RAP1 n=1 Tax=Sporothrix epigloea TaxID=1892477 RepID=A0ABP0DTP1_9PEZI